MDASKLTINPEHLRFKKMSNAQRIKLRRQNIMDLISSKPAGTPITMKEFAAVTQTVPSTCNSMLRTMIKRGMISKVWVNDNHSASFSVIGTEKVIVPPKTAAAMPPPAPTTTRQPAMKRLDLTSYAQEFAWAQNSDSLRDFVKWMDGKELELRRTQDN